MDHIQPIIQKIINDLKKKSQIDNQDIQQIWNRATTKKIAKNTLAKVFKNSILYVNVKNSSWKYDLSIKKEPILKKLNKHSSKLIKDIKFRIGDVNG